MRSFRLVLTVLVAEKAVEFNTMLSDFLMAVKFERNEPMSPNLQNTR